jgi:flap endonuclease-1
MGIRGLLKLLVARAPGCMIERPMTDYSKTALAVEVLIQLFRFVIAIRGSSKGDMVTSDGRLKSHVYGIFHKVMTMLKHGVLPVWVFEGTPPLIKAKTLQKRKESKAKAKRQLQEGDYETQEDKVKFLKRTFCIKDAYVEDIQELIDLMGLPSIKSLGEAEAQCACLNIANKVSGVVSEDWDTLVFGAQKMLKNYSVKSPRSKPMFTEIDRSILLEELDLTDEQFVELCILIGTDYYPGIKGFTSITLYDMYIKDKSIPKFLERVRRINQGCRDRDEPAPYDIPEGFDNMWPEIKKYYTKAEIIDPDNEEKIHLKWREPQYDKLFDFLCKHFEFPVDKTKTQLKTLRDIYKEYQTCGELSGSKFIHSTSKNQRRGYRFHRRRSTPVFSLRETCS